MRGSIGLWYDSQINVRATFFSGSAPLAFRASTYLSGISFLQHTPPRRTMFVRHANSTLFCLVWGEL